MSDEQEILVVESPGVVDVVEVAGDVLELVEVDQTECLVIDPPADLDVVEIEAEVVEIVEIAEQGPAGPPGGEPMPYAKRVDAVGDSVIYRGEAVPGSADSDPVWRISRITLTGDDLVEEWAAGTAAFVHVWLAREGYEYI